MQLTPNQQKIYDLLKEGQWQCMAADFFQKDDRTRISEMRHMDFVFDGAKCDGRCGKKHNSRILMRKLVRAPEWMNFKAPKVSHLLSEAQLKARWEARRV